MRVALACFSFVLGLSLTADAQQPATPNAAATSAQQPSPAAQPASEPNAANTIRRNISLVILDGVVVDQNGKPVTDLKRDRKSVV